jgi:diaminopimelate decarboxylase
VDRRSIRHDNPEKEEPLEPFRHKSKELFCEDIPVARIAAEVRTPFYLYSQTCLEHNYTSFDEAFAGVPHLTCYAVKANSNLAVLSLFRRLGAGFDVVSGGELARAVTAGAHPAKVIFSGVGKTPDEIDLALRQGILQFNVESAAELRMVEARALSHGTVAPIGLRINPDVDAGTHAYLSTGARNHKFGVPIETARKFFRRVQESRHLRLTGISCHIGSQITSLAPFLAAVERLGNIYRTLRAEIRSLRHFDIGGGLGIRYHEEAPPAPEEYARAVIAAMKDLDCILVLEPGRILAGNAGILVASVLLTKQAGSRTFVILDAGMNDLMRPSLYGSYHRIVPVMLRRRVSRRADVVGPICESGDVIARDRIMTVVKENELVAVMSAGAYGFALSSNYNARPRAAEVFVKGDRFKIIRKRETYRDLIRGESSRPL